MISVRKGGKPDGTNQNMKVCSCLQKGTANDPGDQRFLLEYDDFPVILFDIGICFGYCGIDCGIEQE